MQDVYKVGETMLKLDELQAFLDDLLPSKGLEDYAPNGLQVEGKETVDCLATAVSASLATIEAAVSIGVNALIVHHGIFWQRDSYVIQGIKQKKLALLLKHGISLFAYHLPLDMHPQIGNNWKAAKDMGWENLAPFAFIKDIPIGVKGTLPGSTQEEFKQSLENYYQHSAAVAWGGPKIIQTVALVSGGAHKTILEAAKEGIDAFVTGSFDEPIWHQAMEEKVNFYALGHSATERVGPMGLANHLEKFFHVPCPFIDIPNPF